MPEDGPNFGPDKLTDSELTQGDYIKAAFKWQYNLIGLIGAAAYSVISGSPLPLVLASGLELMYLALLPQNSRFRRLARSWKFEDKKREQKKRLNEIYRNLPTEMRSRAAYLMQTAQAIRTTYAQLEYGSHVLASQMDEKLNGLLESHIRLLQTARTHREYLKSLNPDQVRTEAEYLEKSLDKEPLKVREINQRRIDILRKRLDKFEKIRENSQVVDAQCAAVEDVLQLIRDQSVTMKDPRQISAQLDHLVADVEQTEQSVREMEEIFALTASPADELTLPPAEEETRGATRNRIRN